MTDPPRPLLNDSALERSRAVANARMNRQRGLTGVNSYERELGFDPAAWLRARLAQASEVAWLDLCCGAGRALVEAARQLAELGDRAALVGVDLVDQFETVPPDTSCLQLQSASLHHWAPARQFDLITCVHGLHYLGDKLGLIERAAHWLTPDGKFAANLDLNNLRGADGRPLGRVLHAKLRSAGFRYSRAKHLLTREGSDAVSFGMRYLGSDDQAGPNYSGQEAVNSYYSPADA